MEQNKKNNANDFFLNLGATVSLYTIVFSLMTLLFTVIDSKFPKITNSYQYFNSSISWQVAILIIFFPIFITLMWVIGKNYESNPESKNSGIHKWLTYLTLFIAGIVLTGDLITVLYYFLDGQEITKAFLLKILALLVVSGSVFGYYISDIREKLNSTNRKYWRIYASLLVIGSIIWGFSVLGSPYTQRLYKYDSQKISDLQNLVGSIEAYYRTKSKLPENLNDLKEIYYYNSFNDPQSNIPYEYQNTGELTYKLCAMFNKSSLDKNSIPNYLYPMNTWSHPEGKHCFDQKIDTMIYTKPMN